MLKLKINSIAKQQDGSRAVQIIVYDEIEPKTILASFTQKIEKNYDKIEIKNSLKSKIQKWKATETQTKTKTDIKKVLLEIESELF